MRSHDEIVRIYQRHFGHSHEAGLFAVFAAGVEDGRAMAQEPTTQPTPVVKLPPATANLLALPVKPEPAKAVFTPTASAPALKPR